VFAESCAAQAAADQALHQRVLEHCAQALTAAAEATAEQLSELRFLRADSLRHLGRWSDAADEFAAVTALDGSPVVEARACRAWRLLSEIARRSRRYDEAVTAAERSEALATALDDTFGRLFSRIPRARVLTDRATTTRRWRCWTRSWPRRNWPCPTNRWIGPWCWWRLARWSA